jgi:membrane protein DedA with SNARE-associated domain
LDSAFDWIAVHNYAAYAVLPLLLMAGIVGLPIPDETLLVFYGALIARGVLRPEIAGIVALGGSWCGITISYLLGRTLGIGFVHRFGKSFHLTEERLARVHQWFDRLGHWALFVGYFIAGVRHFTAIVAGTSRLEYRSFAMYAYSGGALWVASFLTLGYFVGDNWRQIDQLVHRYILYGSLVLIAAVALYLIWWRPWKKA